MVDVFYFSSPRKPSSTPRYRPSSRKSPKILRKRHYANPDMFTQKSCVAHCEEPIFCSNNVPAMCVSGSFLHRIAAYTRDTPSRFDLDYDDDDNEDYDDDESGGVSLLPTGSDPDMTDVPVAVRNAGASSTPSDATAHDHTTDEPSLPERLSTSLVTDPRTSSSRRPSHPRPTTREGWEEEDGRRTRFALEGDAEAGEPLFDLPAAAAHGLIVARPGSTHETRESSQPLPRANSNPPLRPPSRRQSIQAMHFASHTSHQPTPAEIEAAQLILHDPHHNDEMDEDALSVDDPRRHYDFAEFMDTWRLRSTSNKQLPPFEPGMQSSIRLGRPPEQITRENVESGAVDMQGLRWNLLGPTRKQATTARAMLHPSGLGHGFLSAKQQRSSIAGEQKRYYHFRSFLPKHQARFSHYQLRNVLAASSRNEVFYANGNVVKRASLACPALSDTIMDLTKPGSSAASFRITCLSASPRQPFPGYRNDSILIAGGFHGEYAILNLDASDAPSEGFVTHAYNGLVTHIHSYQDRRSGLPQAAFCSNDRQVRLMDFSTLNFKETFTYENAVNCAATSADGRLRVLVGDYTETLITDAERGTPLVTLIDHNDHGFACAWSQDGRNVATAAQDGTVLVWDARKWSKPLIRLDTIMSCARSLNFTDNGALVVAENDDVVRVYDEGKFDAWQEIRFFGSIAGVALLDGGKEIAIANADQTVGGLMSFERTGQGNEEFNVHSRGRSGPCRRWKRPIRC